MNQIQYHTNLGYRPPLTPDIQRQRMMEMAAFAPDGQAGDAFAAGLNLPAYQREAENANLGYRIGNQNMQHGMALAGLGNMAQQQSSEQSRRNQLAGSLLAGLMGGLS